MIALRRVLVTLCLVWCGFACTSEAYATLVLKLDTPSGPSPDQPTPNNMAPGGQLNVSGTISWSYTDPNVIGVMLDVTGADASTYYYGQVQNFNQYTYDFSQPVTIPNGAVPGPCKTQANGWTQAGYIVGYQYPSDTKWFAVAAGRSQGGL